MNRQLRKLLTASEDKLRWYRTPTGLRFVRVANANPDHRMPRHIGEFEDCEILGYTTADGALSRIIYVLAGDGPDGVPDGTGDWSGYDRYKGEPADPAAFRLKCGLQPPSIDRSSDDTIAQERQHRIPAIKYWAETAAQRERKAAREEAERLREEQEATARIIAAAPPPRPKRWWQRIFSR